MSCPKQVKSISHSRSRVNSSCTRASAPLSQKPVPSTPSPSCCAGSRRRKTVCLSDTLRNTPQPPTPVRALKEVRVQLNWIMISWCFTRFPLFTDHLLWFGFRWTLIRSTSSDPITKMAGRASLRSNLTQFSNTMEMIQPNDHNPQWVMKLCKAAVCFFLTIWQTSWTGSDFIHSSKIKHFVNIINTRNRALRSKRANKMWIFSSELVAMTDYWSCNWIVFFSHIIAYRLENVYAINWNDQIWCPDLWIRII